MNKIFRNIIMVIFISTVTCIIFAVPIFAEESEASPHNEKTVLFISSYSYDWPSVPLQIEGFENEISNNTIVNYLFMNTKNIDYENAYENLQAEIERDSEKYSSYDCIVAADDDAFNFVMEYKEEYFGGAPVVFLGINNEENAAAAVQNNSNVTGIIEQGFHYDTLLMAEEIYPDADKVLAITDDSNTAEGTRNQFNKAVAKEGLKCRYLNTSYKSRDEIVNEVSTLDDTTILYFLNFRDDADGDLYNIEQASEFLYANASVPVFCTDVPSIKYGMFGGVMISFSQMGERAAEMCNQIFSMQDISDIGVETAKGVITLNNDSIEKYDVQVPDEIMNKADIVNPEITFRDKYQKQIILGIEGLLVLLIIIILAITIKSNKKLNMLNKKLHKEREIAENANNAKSEFLANMSHELRTPLNAIIGINTLVSTNLDNKELAEDYLEKIDLSSKILLSTINNILDMSAMESGILKLDASDFSIKDLLYSVTSIYYMLCKDKDIKFEVLNNEIEREMLVGDSYRIRQILLNLLSNALKFTDKGGVIYVNVSETAIDEVHTELLIEVKDTGCGFAKKTHEKLFAKFEQEDVSTVRQYGGSGLGLSITKNLLDMMEGEIQVESEPGIGSVFTVTIPLRNSEKMKFDKLKDLSHLHVMIVDDSIETCQYISQIILNWNLNSEYFTEPAEALETALNAMDSGHPYNLFIIDINMPEMNGTELAQRLRKTVSKEAAIIMISGYDVCEFENDDKDSNTVFFLQKPVFPSELYDKIISAMYGEEDLKNTDIGNKKYRLEEMKVLVVEDNEINRIIVNKFLINEGAEVTTVINGKKAIEAVMRRTDFDVILMDLQMPVMDGYEATKIIRAMNNEYAKNIPIFAMTANTFTSDIENCMKAGMNGHIPKPINIEFLISTLEQVR